MTQMQSGIGYTPPLRTSVMPHALREQGVLWAETHQW